MTGSSWLLVGMNVREGANPAGIHRGWLGVSSGTEIESACGAVRDGLPPWVFALLACTACVPDTPYRYTAMVPPVRPMTWDGATARNGSLRVEGNIAGAGVLTNLVPQLHDTALLVPRTTLGAAATLAVASGFEFGARATYAAYAWNTESAVGTQPLPSAPSLLGVGPELHGTIRFGNEKRFGLGIAANALYFSVPYAEWQAEACMPSRTCVDGYSLVDERTEGRWALNLGLYPSYAPGPPGRKYGRVFVMMGLHTGYKNDGFTDAAQAGSSIKEYTAGLLGAGYGIEFDAVHVSAMLFQPFAGHWTGVAYTIGGLVTIGVDLRIWGSDKEREPLRPAHPREVAPRAQSPQPTPAEPAPPPQTPDVPIGPE
jgi:hypothetical protein